MVKYIEFFGEKLSKLTGKPAISCRGLLRFAIEDAGKDALKLTYSDLKEIFENFLSKRLESVKVTNHQAIAKSLSVELTKNQSILTVAV